MKKRLHFTRAHHAHHTLIHYFLSYFIPLSFLLISFFLIVRSQLSDLYLDVLNKQANQQLENVTDQFTDNLMTIDHINNSLKSNINLIQSRYNSDSWAQYLAFQELNAYSVGNSLVESIIYYDKLHNTILSSGKYVHYDNEKNAFYIHNGERSIAFYPDEDTESIVNQLTFISDGVSSYLLYVPYTDPDMSYRIFYILNRQEVQNLLKIAASGGVTAVALVSPDGQIAAGVNDSLLTPYLSSGKVLEEEAHLGSQTSLQFCTGLYSNFTIAALISNEVLMSQVSTAFSRTYLILFLLGIAGMFFILYAMKGTYLPLRKLTQKIVEKPNPNQGYLEQLDSAFTSAITENQSLQEKINKYRLSMQKSIFDSIVSGNQSVMPENFDYIESFFTLEPDNLIFALRMKTSVPKEIFPFQEIMQFFNEALPGNASSCIVFESSNDSAVFLLNYSGTEQNKEESIHTLLDGFYEDQGYLSALSNGSFSPMDIPSLYENALRASKRWPQTPVVSFNTIARDISSESSLSYPYERLDKLTQSLKGQDFPSARVQIQELFKLIENSSSYENLLPDFFVRCVLIDILTALINAMNQANMKFKTYSEIYFETLYFCRSCPYKEKKQEIQAHVEQLLDLFESETENNIINASQIQHLVLENYTSADFSISYLADYFHVSIAYMSFLFKKEMGENFSDYVWMLRLEKARGLLLTTDMSIDEISIAIGYANTSSFRRKFKQSTGLTPSQLRSENFDI